MPLNHATHYTELTQDQYAALGKLVVEWSNIEYLLGVLLSRLLKTPEYLGRTYADGLSAVRLQAAVTEAVAIHRHRYRKNRISEADLSKITYLNNRVTQLRSDRNKVSHFCWMRSNDYEVFGTSLSGGVPDPKSERRSSRTLDMNELKQLHAESYVVVEELMCLIQALPAVSE